MGEVELSLVGGNTEGGEEEKEESHEEEKIEASQTFPLKVDAARGIVYAVREDQTLWQHQMAAPITAMWVQDGHRLSRVNLSCHSVLPKRRFGHPALMMGAYVCVCVWGGGGGGGTICDAWCYVHRVNPQLYIIRHLFISVS